MSKSKKTKEKKPTSKPSAQENFFDRAELWLAKNGKWFLLLGWLSFLALYLSLASDELGGVLGGDNARYLMLAKSLASGKGYRDLLFANEPAHTQYPFLFPLLISPFAGSDRQVFYTHLFIQFLASLIPLLIAGWARLEGMSRLKCLFLFFLVGSLPAFFSFLLNILTEILFIFFMSTAFFLLSYLRNRGIDLYKILLFSFCILFTALTREAGLVLFIAVFLGLLFDSRFRKIKIGWVPFWSVYLAVFMLGYGAWSFRNVEVGGGGVYFQQFLAKNPYYPELGRATVSDIFQRISDNTHLHIPHLGGFAFPAWLFSSESTALFISGIFFALSLVGIIFRLVRRNFVVELSFLSLFALAMVWFYKEERFSFPVLPLVGFYFLKALEELERIFKGLKPIFLTLISGLLLWQIGLLGWLTYKYHQHLLYPRDPVEVEGYGEWREPAIDLSQYSNYWQSPEEYNLALSDWIVIQKVAGEILPESAVIISRKAPITWYYSGRKSNWYRMGVSSEKQWQHLKEAQATHLLVAGNPELINLLNQYPENFRFLVRIRRTRYALFEILSYPEF